MSTLADNERQALDWANAVRTEWGLEPLDEMPQGYHMTRTHCALGRALEGRAVFNLSQFVAVPDESADKVAIMVLPPAVQAFEADFERGYYPHLSAHASDPKPENVSAMRPTASDSPWEGPHIASIRAAVEDERARGTVVIAKPGDLLRHVEAGLALPPLSIVGQVSGRFTLA